MKSFIGPQIASGGVRTGTVTVAGIAGTLVVAGRSIWLCRTVRAGGYRLTFRRGIAHRHRFRNARNK